MSKTHTGYTGPTGMQTEGGLMEILERVKYGAKMGYNVEGAYHQIIQWAEQVIGENEKDYLAEAINNRGGVITSEQIMRRLADGKEIY